MKKVSKLISVLAILFCITVTNPVIAQTTDTTTTTTTATDNRDDDDNGKWGLAGLLGLLGLLGLKRKDDDRRTSTTVRRD